MQDRFMDVMQRPSRVDLDFSARSPGIFSKGIVVLLALSFFLPYVAGTRLRVDVVFCYVAILVLPFAARSSFKELRRITIAASLALVWTCARIGFGGVDEENAFFAIQLVTALNFLFFSSCIFLVMRPLLVPQREILLAAILWISVAVNLGALFQWFDVDHPLNAWIFRNYGGALPASVEELPQEVIGGITTNAEFLARIAGRYSSIFGGMYVLAAFNVLIIAMSIAAVRSREFSDRMGQLAGIAIGFALLGGVLSASKTFYLGSGIVLAVLGLCRVLKPATVIAMFVIAIPSYWLLRLESDDDSTVGSVFDLVWGGDMAAILGSRYSEDGLLGTIETVVTSSEILLMGVGTDIRDLFLADNGYLMPLIIGGAPLFALTYVAIALLLRENLRQARLGNTMAAGFFAVHVSFLVAAIGITTYQLPRVTLLLLLLNYVFLACKPTALAMEVRGQASNVRRQLEPRP